ncbi:MAG TPA: chromosome segregation protein SMC [Thermoanaerobaculia bacterium]|nr:chromosome segregation protein SMC [Thermoanaerobaculia bacterium]
MLKLERLEISGFKSFVDPVTVEFAGGITAIIGPNGCGKSNLSDAMTWVLGEQSAKSLRGSTMEDVIFNGSDSRKPLGMAEATLSMRTDPSLAASEDGRITISRRVFRGGESQYRLNGKLVRLKDIRDLLMDTGLGIRAYSVIEQGKIGLILSGKPQERRKLIEEAAGITRYKQRKDVAEVKLQEATANLLRLDDIVAEVERALRSLKRQAGAARRYQEKEAEYRQLLEEVLLGRHRALAGRLAGLATGLAEALSREAALAADLHRDEAGLAAGRLRLDELARAVAERHQRQAELAAAIEGRQQFLKGNRQTVQEIAERVTQARASAERRGQEIERNAGVLDALEARRLELAAERDQAASAVDEDERRIADAERDLRQVTARVESLRSALAAAQGEANTLRNRHHQAQIEQEKGNYRRHHLDEEIARHGFELQQAEEALAVARERVATIEANVATRATEQEKVAGTLDATMKREGEASERKRSLEAELSGVRQRQRILADLSRAHAERRKALVEALASAGIPAAFLAGEAKALAGWERSLDFYLGALADAVVLPAGQSALAVAHQLAGRSAASLVERQSLAAEGPEGIAGVDHPADPAIVLTVGEALGLSPELAAALPPGFLVKTGEDAARLARRHPGSAFLSRDGVWVQAGTFHVEGEVASPGILERERELADLGIALPRLEADLQEAGSDLERLIVQRASLARDANRLQGEVAQLRQERAVAQARQEDAAARHRRLAAEQQTLATEQEEVAREIARIAERQRGLEEELAAAEAHHGGLQEHSDRAQAEAEAAKAARESLKTASAGRRGRLELLEERLESQDREMGRLQEEVEGGRRQIHSWQEEAAKLSARRTDLEAAIARAETELQTALEQRAAAEEGVLEEQERLDLHRQEIKLLEERIQLHRERREGARGEVEELRITEARLKQDAEHLSQTFAEQFSRPLPELSPEEPIETRGSLAEMEGELARCKDTLDRLGPVNILAVQEYAEQEERHTFLTAQRTDVASSVESLRNTIKEINQASSERFITTFREVNQTFGEVFTRLFRGGEAEMRLLDEEDVLESGIEIVARPPGKRLQNLMLMSGGEKALTAIALLFALFRAKPSPFCILDEVDAPLDDVNTVRFVDLLKELAGETQFIVITHNKLSMEVASTLYGVTMEERGVSKLVAVEMEEVQPERQAATA